MELLNAVAIDKAITSIKTRGANLDKSIWECGVSCLNHATEHGDTTLLDKLLNALPKGARKVAFTEWVLAHGQVRLLDGKVKAEKVRIKNGGTFILDRERVLDLQGAMSKSWVEFKPEASVQTAFDLQGSVMSLVKRYESAVSKGLTVEGKDDALATLKALTEALERA